MSETDTADELASDQSQTREALVRVSFDLFGRHGFDGVSIDQISRAAGLSKGAMYWYFRNKEALFVECLKRLRKLLIAHIYAPTAATDEPRGKMQLFFRGIRAMLLEIEDLESVSGLMIGLERIDRPLVQQFRHELITEAESYIREILEHGQSAGVFRFPGATDEVASALFVMVEGCLVQTRRANIERSLKALETLNEGFFLAYGRDGQR